MSDAARRVLLAEDDAGMRSVMRFNLQEQSFVVTEVERGDEAVRLLSESGKAAIAFDLVITDLKMPGADGMAVLKAARARSPTLPVILVTAFGTLEQVSAALEHGAADYITKPFQRAEFKSRVAAAMGRVRDAAARAATLPLASAREAIVTASPRFQEILRTVERISPTDATVLVYGESGTGKELIARMIHRLSGRTARPFLPVNCAALPRDLLENEIFGHERGAFTGADRAHAGKFERADGGTLFLDEIGDMPMDIQAKLLRVLEEGVIDRLGSTRSIEVDVRVIAATNLDLKTAADEGRFRTDLFHRLSVIPIALPPLRERAEDIPLLVARFLEDLELHQRVAVAPGLLRELCRHPWPGNVRELKNVVSRMALLRRSDVLDLPDLAPIRQGTSAPSSASQGAPGAPPTLRPGEIVLPEEPFDMQELEREILQKALTKHGGNRSAAARYLGIARHVLLYRIEKYELE